MKRILLIITVILSIMACKDDHPDLNSEEKEINLLRADFEKQTGYDQSKEYLLAPVFRTRVNWNKVVRKSKDTILVSVIVLDTVFYPVNGSEVNLKDNVILKAVRNEKSEWSYVTVTFVPTGLANGYSGLIFSRLLAKDIEKIQYFNNGVRVDDGAIIKRKFANTHRMAQTISKLRAGCTYGYVNGVRVAISCPPPKKGEREIDGDPGLGQPGDYFPPGHGGGSGGGTTSPSAEDKEIIDSLQGYPCAQAVLAKIPNLQNKISEWLKKEFGKIPSNGERIYTIKFNASLQLGNNVDGQHIGYETSVKEVHLVTLNGNMLKTASQEYIAATMFHESLHAFLLSERLRLKALNQENQFAILYPGWTAYTIGGQVKYANNHNNFGTLLEDLKNALKTFNPSLTESEASALTKGGVITSMTQAEIDINKNHKDGKTGTKCKP